MWPREKELNAFYGNPDADHNGAVDPRWEAENIVRILPAYPMFLAWAPEAPVKGIACHKKVAGSLGKVLSQIAHLDDSFIRTYGLHLYGGAYGFRMKRGAPELSVHSWGAAIDLSPSANAWKRRLGTVAAMMPHQVVEFFEDEGWTWGGGWKTPDAMHFQAAGV